MSDQLPNNTAASATGLGMLLPAGYRFTGPQSSNFLIYDSTLENTKTDPVDFFKFSTPEGLTQIKVSIDAYGLTSNGPFANYYAEFVTGRETLISGNVAGSEGIGSYSVSNYSPNGVTAIYNVTPGEHTIRINAFGGRDFTEQLQYSLAINPQSYATIQPGLAGSSNGGGGTVGTSYPMPGSTSVVTNNGSTPGSSGGGGSTGTFYTGGVPVGTGNTPTNYGGIGGIAYVPNAVILGPGGTTSVGTSAPSVDPRGNGLVNTDVFRFYNKDSGTHFYTANTSERDNVLKTLPNFVFEGNVFDTYATASNGSAVYRFLNRDTGSHFYTISVQERDRVASIPSNLSYEGEAYKAYTTDAVGRTELYRFLETKSGTHFYTTSESEKQNVINTLPSYRYEGVAYYVDIA